MPPVPSPPLYRAIRAAIAATILLMLPPAAAPADAQILKRLGKAARESVAGEAEQQVDRVVRQTIRCAVDDPECARDADADGSEVVYVDDGGEVITGEDGQPIGDREAAAAAAATTAASDFQRGSETLVIADYQDDNLGDFPRRLSLVHGSWEVLEWQGERWMQATSSGLVAIPLPRTLPQRFTLEMPVRLAHGNSSVHIMPGRAFYGPARKYRGSVITVDMTRSGVSAISGTGPTALTQYPSGRVSRAPALLRVMADGEHMKVYLDDARVANVPNAVFPRADTLFVAVGSASAERPVLVGAIRIADGGRNLYDRLEAEGRVATNGILFATGSHSILPESAPVLEEIATTLSNHPDLRLRVEGHTDAEGDDAFNQTLSKRRAASVTAYLTEHHGIEPARLEPTGFGESQPVADNATAEGRRANRRVELVRLP